MYRRILVATDGSDFANMAVEQASDLAAGLGAELYIVTVSEALPVFSAAEIGWSLPQDVYEQMRKADAAKARRILDKATGIAKRHGAPIREIHIAGQDPYAGILEAAGNIKADLIVLASHSKSVVDRLLLGSQASKVLSLATIPVLVVRS